MDLDQQLQILVKEAPKYGVPVAVMKQAVVPVLKRFAQQLQHLDYYLLQSADQQWLSNTIVHRQQPNLKKTVIYAFSSAEDAIEFQKTSEAEMSTVSLPVTHILFQLFALQQIDSLIFLTPPGQFTSGVEIQQRDLREAITQQFQSRQSNLA